MREPCADSCQPLSAAQPIGLLRVRRQPLDRRIDEDESRNEIGMSHGVAAHDEAAERMTDEDAALARCHPREHGFEFVNDPIERPRARGNIAPRKARAIVDARACEPRDRRLHGGPAE